MNGDSGIRIRASNTRRAARIVCLRGMGTVTALAACACSGNQAGLNPHGPIARSITVHSFGLLAVCSVVYVAVMIAFFIALRRRRRDSDDLPETTARLTRNVVMAV